MVREGRKGEEAERGREGREGGRGGGREEGKGGKEVRNGLTETKGRGRGAGWETRREGGNRREDEGERMKARQW